MANAMTRMRWLDQKRTLLMAQMTSIPLSGLWWDLTRTADLLWVRIAKGR